MKILLSILLVLSFFAYSATKDKPNNSNFQLPDSLFIYKNIKNSLIVNHFWRDFQYAYADSIKSKILVPLDSIQKLKLIVPVMSKEIGIDTNYILHSLVAVFVSKQERIGDFTPIIVWIDGDDYSGLHYILLDKTFKYVSHVLIYGGFNPGPFEMPDRALRLPSIKHSFLNRNKISTYKVTEYFSQDSIPHPSIIDSINYVSTILPSGQIETKQTDSTRYLRTHIE